ncbi:arylsulfatase [Lacibacter sp.]|uniref:arylsulfatase n=1 Tax=Lacibacter sp. TaxID=1915409 RepID=UPI002B4B5855|nr:arylsulfatase [Lacibacter sp.]HLP37696.1 arylsulfatase [Lacibacter sp.]
MSRKIIQIISVLFLFAYKTETVAAQTNPSRPNIIIIMADDLGYSDLGCFGGEINTPNLDRLANNGLRMTNFYNNSRCCPTRASLLTGQYAHKVGLANNGNALTRNGATIAELLKQNGYQTGMVGKWHLSDDVQKPTKEEQLKWLNHQAYLNDSFASIESYPINRGFQKHYGIIWGVVNYFDPFSLVNGVEPVKEVPKDYYITDAINQRSVEYIKEFTQKKQPYFLYVAHAAPHWPVHAKPEDIAKYKGKYDMGWDELRKQRYNRMVKMGLINPTTTKLIDVMGKNGAWEKLSAEEKEKQSLKMATHAAMIERLDIGVGQIIKTLEQTNTLNNTVIIFLADNGASPEIPNVPGYDRPSQTRDGKNLQYDKDVTTATIGSEISYTGIGNNWANAANTPYKFWKIESYEGGIHTPMIVHWPAGLKAKKGSISSALGHVTDVLPTLLDIAKLNYPSTYNGHSLTSLDGKSFLPVLQNKITKGRDSVFFQHAKGMAFINKNWKIVSKTGDVANWELYDLSKDKNETTNLSAKQPELFRSMITSWEQWYETMKPYIKLRPGSGPQ